MKRFLIKVLFIAIAWTLYTLVITLAAPLLTTQVAMTQFDNTAGSYIYTTGVKEVMDFLNVLMPLGTALLLLPDFVRFIKDLIRSVQ